MLLLSCKRDEFTQICNYNIVTVREPFISKSLIGEEVFFDDEVVSRFSNISVYDSLLLAYQIGAQDGYYYHIYSLNNNKILGRFIPEGNARNEVLAIAPIRQFKVDKEEFSAYVYDFGKQRTSLWNISESMEQNVTKFDLEIKHQEREMKESFTSLFYLLGGKFIGQTYMYYNPYSNEKIISDYYICDINSDSVIKKMNLYNDITPTGKDLGKYLQSENCIKPDRSKLVIAMQYQPHIAIINLDNNEVKGTNIRNGVEFNSSDSKVCFCSVDVDDDYIYALFVGDYTDSFLGEGKQPETVLYKFDWDGDLKEKYIFKDFPIFRIAIDRSCKSNYLYGVNIFNEKVYRYSLDK